LDGDYQKETANRKAFSMVGCKQAYVIITFLRKGGVIMAINAFISFFDKADGESIQKGKEKWVEILGWDWEVEAETSWTKGGGSSVGKPNPGKMKFRAPVRHLVNGNSWVQSAQVVRFQRSSSR
jgi:hypothetical protein